ncbi:MAG: T9SS type A sorting domain-containing protein, partial [Ignavibacteriae bacterium]|nr:T9SS type A sorting domain-containing protein [Ignavibacteriota bacterium]
PTTKIDYELPYDGKVSIVLYDISGREVVKLVNEVENAGYYSIQFNGANLTSGMYFYRINAEGSGQKYVNTKKMVLIK